MVCYKCVRNSLVNPVSIFDTILVALSICTNLTRHTAMVTNLSKLGAIRNMPKTCLCVTGFYLDCIRRSSFCYRGAFLSIYIHVYYYYIYIYILYRYYIYIYIYIYNIYITYI